MLSQLLPMLAITFTVFVLFFIFMGIGYMVKKSRLEDLVAVLPNWWAMKTAHFVAMIPTNAIQSSQSNKKVRSKRLN